MSTPAASSNLPHVVQPNAAAFAERLSAVATAYQHNEGACIIFWGGSRVAHQQTLPAIMERTTDTIHQFTLGNLLGERRMQTQSALRKAFDHAAEEDALLFFEAADVIFTWSHDDSPHQTNEAMPSTAEYFFQRVTAFTGPVVLALDDATPLAALDDPSPVVMVVAFDNTDAR
ncbi:hypothetical protein [Salisaeta longa]|uniref:hypothetical protein n=1 Tax=Salisaeta longa TaxID=503170 RepID=UPI0003B3EF67|nr:hypothetical protein [Salisaeta longa]